MKQTAAVRKTEVQKYMIHKNLTIIYYNNCVITHVHSYSCTAAPISYNVHYTEFGYYIS